MGSSASLDRSPRRNWVENSGGLPPYVREIARSIEKTGKTLQNAIQIALSRIKVWAAGKGVTAKTQAKAAKALAEWEKTRANNAARKVEACSVTYDEMDALALSVEIAPDLAELLRLSHGVDEQGSPGMVALSRVALAASARTRTDGKPSNDPASTKKFAASEWKSAPEGMKCSRHQHGDNPPPAVAYRVVDGKKLGACKSHKDEMTQGASVKASAGADALDRIALAGGSQPTKTKGSGDGSGKHDLIFFEHRSTPKVVSRGQQLGDYPDSYGKVTKRRAATSDEESKINGGDGAWLRVDESGKKPSDSGYKKTQVRPGLVKKGS